MTTLAIQDAVFYLRRRGFKIPADVAELVHSHGAELTSAEMGEVAKERKTAIKAAGSYEAHRQNLWAAVYDAVTGFLNSNSQVGTYSRPLVAAVADAYINTSEIAYEDGGGSLPLDDDTLAWAKAELDAQFAYVDSLFERLKALRKEGDYDAIHEGFMAADRWSNALTGFYNAIKLMGAKNKMLTWNLGSAEKHCKDCLKLDGQRHRASWYASRGYFPRRPGSNTECGGFNCDCSLTSDDGEDFTYNL